MIEAGIYNIYNLDLQRGVQWRSLGSVGASIGDAFEGVGIYAFKEVKTFGGQLGKVTWIWHDPHTSKPLPELIMDGHGWHPQKPGLGFGGPSSGHPKSTALST